MRFDYRRPLSQVRALFAASSSCRFRPVGHSWARSPGVGVFRGVEELAQALSDGLVAGSVAYDPPLRHKRTPAERADQLLSWQRNDKAFFASGACHILAWAFLRDEDRADGFSPTGLRPAGARYVQHVYVSDGTWAFDHDGWTREDELLTVTKTAHEQANPGEAIEQVTLPRDLELYCAENYLRLPSQYAFDPLPRANAYLGRFSARLPQAR
jgi:hypothetical protein